MDFALNGHEMLNKTTAFINKISAFSGIALCTTIVLLWIYKFPSLNLPFFWDEAWSYAPAVWNMCQNKLCLLPCGSSADLYRGHPLWFYFMNAAIAKISGFTPLVLHLFSLVLSSLFLVICFFVFKEFFDHLFACLGVMLIASQEIFIVQSSFMLPEIFIALLSVVSIYSFLRNKKILFAFSSSILVLTKESGMIIPISIFLVVLLLLVKNRKHAQKTSLSLKRVVGNIYLIVPLAVAFLFHLMQKEKYGWYFYPFHIALIDFDKTYILQHLKIAIHFIFLDPTRVTLSCLSAMVLFLIIFFKSGIRWSTSEKKLLLVAGSIFIFYLLFSVVNFILLRYLFVLIVIFIFILLTCCYRLQISGYRIFPYLLGLAIFYSLYNDFNSNPSWIDDVSINYKDDVAVHQRAVSFLESRDAESATICTHMLMQFNLTHPELFYLHGVPFQHVISDSLVTGADYFVFSNLELSESNYDRVKADNSIELLQRFEKGKAWCEIYEKKSVRQ